MKMKWFLPSRLPAALAVMLALAGLAAPVTAADPAPATLGASVADAYKSHDPAATRQAMADYLGLLRQPGVSAGPGPYSARLQALASRYAAAPERVPELLDFYGHWHDDGLGIPVAKRPRDLEP